MRIGGLNKERGATVELQGVMGFMSPDRVINDSERPGHFRANVNTQSYEDTARSVSYHPCLLHDLAAYPEPIDFHHKGFDVIDLFSRHRLIAALQQIKRQGVLEKHSEQRLRRELTGAAFRLSNGKRLRFLHIAKEGLILRKSGPNGLAVDNNANTPRNSRQTAAQMVHGDQDVYGYPVKKILKGAAPYLFRHQSPRGSNQLSPLNLVNLWIPLQQITMPLCLLDRRTLNKQQHQLRLTISVQDVLERTGPDNRNDIWAFLHDAQQQWYCHSQMPLGKAYVFDTLGMAHGAAMLQGEERAAQYYQQLKACLAAIENGDAKRLAEAAAGKAEILPGKASPPLAYALNGMQILLEQAAQQPDAVLRQPAAWSNNARAVMDSVVRRSIELRAVAVVY